MVVARARGLIRAGAVALLLASEGKEENNEENSVEKDWQER